MFVTLSKDDLREYLVKAYEEGSCSYSDLKEDFVEGLVDEIAGSQKQCVEKAVEYTPAIWVVDSLPSGGYPDSEDSISVRSSGGVSMGSVTVSGTTAVVDSYNSTPANGIGVHRNYTYRGDPIEVNVEWNDEAREYVNEEYEDFGRFTQLS